MGRIYDPVDHTILAHLSRAQRIKALRERRKNQPKRIADGDYCHTSYCNACGHPADFSLQRTGDVGKLADFCPECNSLRKNGWLTV